MPKSVATTLRSNNRKSRQRRAKVVAEVRRADEEYANGKGIEGTAAVIMRELEK